VLISKIFNFTGRPVSPQIFQHITIMIHHHRRRRLEFGNSTMMLGFCGNENLRIGLKVCGERVGERKLDTVCRIALHATHTAVWRAGARNRSQTFGRGQTSRRHLAASRNPFSLRSKSARTKQKSRTPSSFKLRHSTALNSIFHFIRSHFLKLLALQLNYLN
jgi:hypothetical protein